MNINVLYSIKPIYLISRLTFTYPLQLINGKIAPLSLNEKISCIIMGLLHTIYLVWGFYQRHVNPLRSLHSSQCLLEEISTISTTLLTQSAIFTAVINSSYQNISNFWVQLIKVDKLLQISDQSHIETYSNIRKKLVSRLVLIVVITAVDNYLWFDTKGLLLTAAYFYSYYMYILNCIVVTQIETKIILLKERFCALNQKLHNLLDEANKILYNNREVKFTPFRRNEENVRILNKVFDSLCDLIESVNKTHGVQIIILAFTALTVILNTLVIGFTLFRSATKAEIAISILMQFLWSAYFLMLGIILAREASRTTIFAKKSAVLGHKLLLEYSSRLGYVQLLHYTREELKLLIEQVAYRNPTFSAAGFFTIDYTMIYAILGSVTSYFIVLLQLE